MEASSLHGNSWTQEEDGKLSIKWDSEENMLKVQQRVRLLMKGCGCKSGCRTSRYGCRKDGTICSPDGCREGGFIQHFLTFPTLHVHVDNINGFSLR